MENCKDLTPRRRIEDMTLSEIRGLKKEITDELKGYLDRLAKIVSDKFDVGAIGISVDSELFYGSSYLDGNEIKRDTSTRFDIGIHFSKEEL